MTLKTKWIEKELEGDTFRLLNLDHPEIETPILNEINTGVDVYYDTRWQETEAFCKFLVSNLEWISDRSVLVLGAGMGMETLVVGRFCKKMFINDYSSAALELCKAQLEENGINNYEVQSGRYETLEIPDVDIALGCFLIYNKDTLSSMLQFMDLCSYPIILMNCSLSEFRGLLKKTDRTTRILMDDKNGVCALFENE